MTQTLLVTLWSQAVLTQRAVTYVSYDTTFDNNKVPIITTNNQLYDISFIKLNEYNK